ncbi:precorrin-8X methylmutase [Desulfofundulus thermocisternus]|uniref:precorrin-8X methylmutase n=1 Tax=Desulfofundulus thermocisternus TaxID=42471 RepID=UPI00217E6FDE|nr:precorrin-8X methylmutase [Desulfofundulus thermocisternus]MCS5695829.1 precorrin-8X methylmutase [Desulfofundulus thermocisternus]
MELFNPAAIEKESMRIIEENLPDLATLPAGERSIIKRVVHTTGDLSCARLIRIHPRAVENGLRALKAGKPILTDVNMVRSGLIKNRLASLGVEVICLINHPEVIKNAQMRGTTRAMVAMELGVPKIEGGIIAIGNAPTALFTLCRLVSAGQVRPALVVGTPVGFVGAAESKEELISLGIPYITMIGTRGGSTIAAAIINALLLMA